MQKYRKKPVVIEAVELTVENAVDLIREHGFTWGDCGLQIDTLEGVMQATYGDYIIKGVQGGFYPCKPDIFHATYDLERDS